MTSYEFEHSIEAAVSAEAVWKLWSDVPGWPKWDASLEAATLDGPFEVGTKGTMTIEGQGTIGFTLLDVTPGKGFTDETVIPDAVLRFAHSVTELGDGRVRLTLRVEIEGPAAQEMGPFVTADSPEAMAALVALAS